MSFFVKAAIEALKEIPAVNGEIDGDDIIYKNHYDIGVAVGTEQGLVVPVVRDADALSFADIEKKISELGMKARDGKLTIEDLTGGTFTISNGGVYGSLMSTPILNPPQSGILGMHKIQPRPMAVGDKIEIRPMMYLALSYDHRIIDGREAVTFLVRIKECIEDPAAHPPGHVAEMAKRPARQRNGKAGKRAGQARAPLCADHGFHLRSVLADHGMTALDPKVKRSRALELQLWREANTIFMGPSGGHGGCGALGLALAAHRRGFKAEVHLNHKGVLLAYRAKTKERVAVMRVLQDKDLARGEGRRHSRAA